MAGMWARYVHLLETRPIITKSFTSATLYLAGDAIAQRLDGTWTNEKSYDVARGRTAIIWGGLCFAPIAHGWYNKVLNPLFPGTSAAAVAKKVFLDQTLWAVTANAAYLAGSNLLLGKTWSQSRAITEEQIWPVLKMNWMTWPAIQVVNFKFVPPPLQLPFINVCILGWCSYLAIKANSTIDHPTATETSNAQLLHEPAQGETGNSKEGTITRTKAK